MDPRRLVVVSYLVFGLVIALFFDHVWRSCSFGPGVVLGNPRGSRRLGIEDPDLVGIGLTAPVGGRALDEPEGSKGPFDRGRQRAF